MTIVIFIFRSDNQITTIKKIVAVNYDQNLRNATKPLKIKELEDFEIQILK